MLFGDAKNVMQELVAEFKKIKKILNICFYHNHLRFLRSIFLINGTLMTLIVLIK